MAVLNDLDRFHLACDVIDRVPKLGYKAAYLKQLVCDKLIEHKQYITQYGEERPEIRNGHINNANKLLIMNLLLGWIFQKKDD